jgi:small subunit ribosomal protein S2
MKETGSIESHMNNLSISHQDITPVHVDSVRADHSTFKRVQKSTGRLGSVLEPFYQPSTLINQPRFPRDVTLELLMASQAHIGHSTSLWNPANQRYIYGVRQGVHIISLETTAAHLRRAAKIVEGVAYHGGLILFVGTRPGQSRAVVKAAELSQGCHLFERWIPGSITNGDQILAACKVKIVNGKDEEIKDELFEEKLEEHRSLKPDLVVCLNPIENYVCLHECGLNNIPTIGIIDTDANPTWVTYPIPANDDR